MHLLVIDDDIGVLAAVRAMIEAKRPDWDAEYVSDSGDALKRLSSQEYDVVLSDLHMPELDRVCMLRHAASIFP